MPEPPPIWSDAFLAEEIREQPEYKALEEDSAEFDAFVNQARQILADMQGFHDTDEQITIERAITPLLEALGWPTPLPKRSLTSRDEVDLTLYADEGKREDLLKGSDERGQVLAADGIVECKPWGAPFDTSGSGSRPGETAAQQIQRYLLIAGTDSNESLRWGILTNGARWRIYSYRARPRDRTWEVDLDRLLVSQDIFTRALNDETIHELRLAWLLLRRDSWIPAPGERESFLDRLLAQGRHADEQIAASLSEAIFSEIYPDLVSALWRQHEDAASDQVANAALTILYRLLFIFYAEDRGMLNTEDPRYREYSLRHGVRDPAVRQLADGNPSSVFTRFWDHLATLTEVLDHGNPQMGLPPYDGGLFATEPGSLLAQARLTDAQLAPIIKQLSHTESGDYISYRNLEIQQLGSIYERLLERVPQRDAASQVEVVVSPYARKDTGSYYTPQELVDLIVEQTLQPLLKERLAAFEAEPTEANDPAAALLRLKILDPAMGSGHFLITAIDWLTAAIEDLLDRSDDSNDNNDTEDSEDSDDDSDDEPPYVSPVQAELDRIEARRSAPLPSTIDDAIRAEIEQRHAFEDQFPPPDRQSLIRRMVLKRCIYGVDKNPMAVELAKVALWLHSFAPPLPLPYLNHRVRAGDSLLGISIDAAHDYLAPWGPGHIARGLFADLGHLVRTTEMPEEQLTDNLNLTIESIGESARWDGLQNQDRVRLRKVLNLTAGLRWLSAGMKKTEQKEFHAPLTEAMSGHPGRADAILHNGENNPGLTPATPEFHQIRDQANEIAGRENFFHWQVEFPHVMDQGGFDAIVSNPPWDRIKLQEVEWWAAREADDITGAGSAAERKTAIARRRQQRDPVVQVFDAATERALQLSAVVRQGDDYPQLGVGDVNLYSLFVERSLSLVKPSGIVGLLVPSGIYSDYTASDFFRNLSADSRVGAIYDFRNSRDEIPETPTPKWFPHVTGVITFCAFIAGGTERYFDETRCGFFLAKKADVDDSDRVFPLTPADFARINPSTGTVPILRNRREAAMITRIYERNPVLVDESAGKEQHLFDVRYFTMFHMSNDSSHFATATDLDQTGAYRTAPHRFKRGEEEWLPLYQGRTVHQFDHRANGVERVHGRVRMSYKSIRSSDTQRENPQFAPEMQYWVNAEEVRRRFPGGQSWAIAFRNVARGTDPRTMIAALVPRVGFGHGLPLLVGRDEFTAGQAAQLLANLNSIALDFIARCKIAGPNLTWYNVKQFAMIAPEIYDRNVGTTTARALVREHVLRLTYTAYDLEPFARDLGFDGEPFRWDPSERRHLRARLDALYFHLYGLNEDDTTYILDQFPTLERNERKEHGRYVTKELVLGYYNALVAGDTDSTITLPPTPPEP